MIYAGFWEASGSRQHVFKHETRLSHYPCITPQDTEDTRNKDFEELWHRRQAENPGSVVRDAVWARRMSSTWNDHWRCEEAMLDSETLRCEKGCSLFLPVLLACRRM
jgi:hypothetical protein